jgi:hypothetical protein
LVRVSLGRKSAPPTGADEGGGEEVEESAIMSEPMRRKMGKKERINERCELLYLAVDVPEPYKPMTRPTYLHEHESSSAADLVPKKVSDLARSPRSTTPFCYSNALLVLTGRKAFIALSDPSQHVQLSAVDLFLSVILSKYTK